MTWAASLLMIVVIATVASGQPFQIGLYADGSRDVHSASFQALPGTFSCSPGFNGSIGSGFSIGGIVSFDTLSLGKIELLRKTRPTIRFGYWETHAQFFAHEKLPIALDTQLASATIEHRVRVSMPSIGVSLGAGTVLRDIPLYLEPSAWIAFGLPGQFEQGEYLVKPANRGRFPETGTRMRNTSSGNFTTYTRFQFGFALACGWELPLSPALSLRPEATIRLPLSSAVAEIPWRVLSLRAGLSFIWTIPTAPKEQSPPLKEPPPPAPTLTTPEVTPTLSLALHFVTRDSNGTLLPIDRVMVETYYRRHIRPLLPYIFFDEGSSTIPSRYVLLDSTECATFDETEVASLSTLEAYYHVLNIVASRLQKRPSAELTITGCISSVGVESNRLDLARARAEEVRRYLNERWGIDTSRLHISIRSLPTHPSPVGHPDGNAENARVELSSTDPAILGAITGIERQQKINPARVFAHVLATPSQLTQWQWTLKVGDSIVALQSGHGAPPTLLPISLPWHQFGNMTLRGKFAAVLGDRPKSTAQEKYQQLSILNRSDTIVAQREVFSLILFNFDDATITASHQPVLDLIRARLEPSTRIHIAGYTDRLGDAAHNRRLAERRALAVARALGVSDRATIEAIGSQILLYDNSTPEGRFYSRTIEVELDHTQ